MSKHQATSTPAQAEQPLFWCNRLVEVAAMVEHPSQDQLPVVELPSLSANVAPGEGGVPVMAVRCS